MLAAATQDILFYCTLGHTTLFSALNIIPYYARLPFRCKYEWSNAVTATLFQLWLVQSMIKELLFLDSVELATAKTFVHYQMLQGYFVYDMIYLLTFGLKYTTFIAHHIGCMCLLQINLHYGFTALWFNMLFPILGEITNPFLNMRRLFKEACGKTSTVYIVNHGILLFLYFGCRIYGFPLVLALHLLEAVNYPYIMWVPTYTVLAAIYAVSIDWFSRLMRDSV